MVSIIFSLMKLKVIGDQNELFRYIWNFDASCYAMVFI